MSTASPEYSQAEFDQFIDSQYLQNHPIMDINGMLSPFFNQKQTLILQIANDPLQNEVDIRQQEADAEMEGTSFNPISTRPFLLTSIR